MFMASKVKKLKFVDLEGFDVCNTFGSARKSYSYSILAYFLGYCKREVRVISFFSVINLYLHYFINTLHVDPRKSTNFKLFKKILVSLILIFTIYRNTLKTLFPKMAKQNKNIMITRSQNFI